MGESAPDVSAGTAVASCVDVSIFKGVCVTLEPDSLAERRRVRTVGGDSIAAVVVVVVVVVFDGLGGLGGACVGGGGGDGGIGRATDGGVSGFIPRNGGNDGTKPASGSVCNEVAAVALRGSDPIELPQVRPEKPLESDCRGSADLDWRSYSESSMT